MQTHSNPPLRTPMRDEPFVPPRPLDLAPLLLIGPGTVAGIGAGPATLHYAHAPPLGAATIAAEPSLSDELLSAVQAAFVGSLPFPLRPLNADPLLPYCEIGVVASTVSGSQVMTVYSAFYTMPPPPGSPNMNMQRGHVPIYAVGLMDVITLQTSVSASALLTSPVATGGYAPNLEDAPGGWRGVSGDHVTYPFFAGEASTTPPASGSAGTEQFAAAWGLDNTYAVISCESGAVRLLSALRYVQPAFDENGLSAGFEFRSFWRAITCTASGITSTTTETGRFTLPVPPDRLGFPKNVFKLWSTLSGGSPVLVTEWRGGGGNLPSWQARAAYRFDGSTPTLLGEVALLPDDPILLTGTFKDLNNVLSVGGTSLLVGHVLGELAEPQITYTGARVNLASPEAVPAPDLTDVAWAVRDFRTGAVQLAGPVPLLRSAPVLTVLARLTFTERDVTLGTLRRVRATGSAGLRSGDTVLIGGVPHPVAGISGFAFDVRPMVATTLDVNASLPVTAFSTAGWTDATPTKYLTPQVVVREVAWFPLSRTFPFASSAVPLNPPPPRGVWRGALVGAGADPDQALPEQKRAALFGPADVPLVLSFSPIPKGRIGAVLVVTVRLTHAGTVTVQGGDSRTIPGGRWVQLRLATNPAAAPTTVTLICSRTARISFAFLEFDPEVL
ncbi:hypothetical protein [Deinococcus sp. QL22]|uniref:hypothetical protein n=1 Tax=Deinococcus sp. QL22 TaxID=2939437 RepID=UPI0020176693|nr:hypothetical protein [Deinococcus sp. QL22]UQN05444.1 hypothetical protein M1R55_11220 [Deinococcus sp. QL22]